MKKRLFFVLFALANILACNRSAVSSDSPVDDAPRYATITAGFANESSKVGLVDEGYGDLQWIRGDELSVFDRNSLITPGGLKFSTETTGPVAEFVSSVEYQLSPDIFALYPFQEDACFAGDDSPLHFSVPTEQQDSVVEASKYFPMILAAASKDVKSLSFHSVTSGIRFSLSRNDVCRVVFKGNSGEILSGAACVSFKNYCPARVSGLADGGAKTVELISDEPLKADTYYYISLIPCAFNHGFTFEFYSASGALLATTGTDSYKNISAGVIGTIKYADKQDSMNRISDGTDISAAGLSNCYLLSAPGSYKFPLYEGNDSNSPVNGAVSAEVLWSGTSAFDFSKDKIVTSVNIGDGYVYFRTPAVQQSGNAVIAVRDEDDVILWSWHLWSAPDYNPEKGVDIINGITLMNRNLGSFAVSGSGVEVPGLMYQWGRKDPFPGYVGAASLPEVFGASECDPSSSLGFSIANPTVFIKSDKGWFDGEKDFWTSGKKSRYDPCPAGWRVPDAGTFSGDYYFNTTLNCVGLREDSSDPYVLFPIGGIISADNGKVKSYHNEAAYWTSEVQAMYMNQENRSVDFGCDLVSSTGASVRCIKE